MKTLQENWEFYRDKCYPDGTTPVQYRECRQAFFSGAAIALSAMSEISGMSDDDALKSLQDLHNETISALERYIDFRKRN